MFRFEEVMRDKQNKGRKPLTITLTAEEYQRLRDEDCGVCLACGEIIDCGVEPDARNYHCDSCGKDRVFGIEEAMLMGRIKF
jgi:hypothetical protein